MEAPEEVKSRLDIVDLIGEYLPLKPAGSGAFKACCPFHHERTPSFFVSRNRQSWHCFGCDIGGDHFSFVERMEGLDFREALELLAAKTGVELPRFDGEKLSNRKRLIEVNDLAVKFYRSVLATSSQAEVARAYLQKRGLDHLTEDLFKIGYAPPGWTSLTDALVQKGVTADELLKAGLAIQRQGNSGVYDRFRDRVMFPIFDVHGNPVGFTGRILTENKSEAKYVNTPETVLYKKSAVLYGLDKAKGEIRQNDLAVIVEGNMDVVSSHQFGIANVIASSGTALTQEQLTLLKRFTTNLAIAFDADAAGQAATLRGLDLARVQDFSIKIITLPPGAGKDPDEAVRKNPQIWKDAIKDAVGIMDWIYQQAFAHHKADRPEEKKFIARIVLSEIKRIADPVERNHWLKKLAFDLNVSEQALEEAMGRTSQITEVREKTHPQDAIRKKTVDRIDERVFALLISRPALFELGITELALKSVDFDDPQLAGLYAALEKEYNLHNPLFSTPATGAGSCIRLPGSLTPEEAMIFQRLAFLAERECEDQTQDALLRELRSVINLLRQNRKTARRKQLEQNMREAERAGDSARIAEILTQFEREK
ncbi:MAG TPA: DNA primase [Patescibacteria group bacterium]|nr:DNA primase [Patescibacteria group bacterium]